jgi:hypothetical protein
MAHMLFYVSRKVFSRADFSLSLRELGLTPSAVRHLRIDRLTSATLSLPDLNMLPGTGSDCLLVGAQC